MKAIEKIPASACHLDEVIQGTDPIVLGGAAKEWPLVKAGLQSSEEAMAYIGHFDAKRDVLRYQGEPAIKGRFAYNDSITGFNFSADRISLDQAFSEVRIAASQDAPCSYYIGSTDIDSYLPGLLDDNAIPHDSGLYRHGKPMVSIWMGNRTVAAAHYDTSDNLVCNMVGHRRFTLFPPEQVVNLYPGPLEPTPGGQVISMVDFRAPDFSKYPKAEEALRQAMVAELEPGDMLFYPGMWWHQVEALDPFNVMINYWWDANPSFRDSPDVTLLHAMLSLRGRSQREKDAWRAIFDYYVFEDDEMARGHLPEESQGPLADLDQNAARRLRATILKRMNR